MEDATVAERAFLDSLKKNAAKVNSNYYILHGKSGERTSIPELLLKCHSEALLEAFMKRPSGNHQLDLTSFRGKGVHYFLAYLYGFNYEMDKEMYGDIDCFELRDLITLEFFGRHYELPHLVALTLRKYKDGLVDVVTFGGDIPTKTPIDLKKLARHAYANIPGSEPFRKPLVEALVMMDSTPNNRALLNKLVQEHHQLAVDMTMAHNKRNAADRKADCKECLTWGIEDCNIHGYSMRTARENSMAYHKRNAEDNKEDCQDCKCDTWGAASCPLHGNAAQTASEREMDAAYICGGCWSVACAFHNKPSRCGSTVGVEEKSGWVGGGSLVETVDESVATVGDCYCSPSPAPSMDSIMGPAKRPVAKKSGLTAKGPPRRRSNGSSYWE